jgi:hypothetical protein
MRLSKRVDETWRNGNAFRNVVGETEEKMQQHSCKRRRQHNTERYVTVNKCEDEDKEIQFKIRHIRGLM